MTNTSYILINVFKFLGNRYFLSILIYICVQNVDFTGKTKYRSIFELKRSQYMVILVLSKSFRAHQEGYFHRTL